MTTQAATWLDYTDMQGPLTFYLNGKGETKTVYAQYYAADGRVQMSAGLKVDKKKFEAGKLPKDQFAHLRRLQTEIDNYEGNMRQAGEKTKAAAIKHLILIATNRAPAPARIPKDTFLNYFLQYLEAVERGDILHDGKKYSKSFIGIAGVVGRLLPRVKLSTMPVEKIREDDLREYGAELTAMGLAKNTVATYFDPVLSFIQGGRRLGRHKGAVLDMRSFRVNREDIDHGVYLTEAEQEKILALPYEGERAMWRNAFILGCQLGMRHSDLSRLTPVHRKGDTVNINTQKTSAPVWVPLNAIARRIWDVYGGVFAIPTLTPFMLFAKEIGQDAGLESRVLFSRTEGGVKVERWMKKWELLGTHTMRRSFSTNAIKAGVPEVLVMRATGHKSTANFRKYIRLSGEEHATLLSKHPYFQ